MQDTGGQSRPGPAGCTIADPDQDTTAFLALGTHWLMFPVKQHPRVLSCNQFSIHSAPAYSTAGDCSDPRAGPSTWPCWTSCRWMHEYYRIQICSWTCFIALHYSRIVMVYTKSLSFIQTSLKFPVNFPICSMCFSVFLISDTEMSFSIQDFKLRH